MTRQNLRRGLIRLVLSAFLAILAVELVTAQTGPNRPARSARPSRAATPPATQPLDPDAQEKLRKLMEMSPRQSDAEAADAPQQEPPKPPARPEARPAQKPALEELNRRARASTQKAGASEKLAAEKPAAKEKSPSDEDDEDFFGPPYPPATPTIDRPSAVKSDSEKSEKVTGPKSKATDDLEWFNFDHQPWEDVIRYFAERIDKPLIGFDTLAVGGELTYKSDRKFTKAEAIDELNLLMQLEGYRFVESEHHIRVVPLSEMAQAVPVTKTYPSRSAFEQADPPRMEYVIVYLQVKDVPARKIQYAFETMFSDDFNIFALEDSNQLKLTGAAHDVHKFLELMDRIHIDENDPRQMRIFQIQTNARDIERMVREILDLAGGAPAASGMERLQAMRGARGRPGATPAPAATPSPDSVDTEVRMSADDRTNTLIVRATPDKLERIAKLIEQIDKRPELEFYTQVTEVKYATAGDVAELLNKILSLEQNQAQQPDWQRLRQLQMQQQQQQRGRGRRTPTPAAPVAASGGLTPEDLLGEGLFERVKKTIRIAADDRSNSLIVYANKDGHERVLNLLKDIDRALPTNLHTVRVENTKVEMIYPTVSQIVQNLGLAEGKKAPSIVPDEINNQFYVLAEREQLQQIQEVIAKLDVPGPDITRHMVSLANIPPSRVAQLIQPLLIGSRTSGAGSAAPLTPQSIRSRLRGGAGAAPSGPAPSQAAQVENVEIIALDEAMMLIVVCPDELWEKVEDTIYLWDDGAVFGTPRLERIPIQQADPQDVAATLNNLYRGSYRHPVLGQSQVILQAEGRDLLIYAIQPAIDEVRTLAEALDHEDSTKYEIFPLANADAASVAQQAQALFGGAGGSAGARVIRGQQPVQAVTPTSGGPLIQAEPATNSLVIQAEPVTLTKIKQFAIEADQRAADLSPIQKIFAMKHARAADVATAVQNLFGGQRQRLGGTMSPTQVRAFPSGAQVVVEAPKEKMEDIGDFIAQLDSVKSNEVTVKFVKLPGVDVHQVAQNLTATARTIQRPDNLTAVFIADPPTENIIVSAPADMMEQVDGWISSLGDTAEIVPVTIELENADPNQVAAAINAMYARAGKNPQQDVQVTVSNGRLVIKTGKQRLEEIRNLVAALDAENEQGLQIRTYQLKIMNAAQVAAQVQGFLRSMSPAQRSGMQPGAFAEPTTNTLVVIASDKQLPMIEGLIAKVESSTGLASDVKAYDLKHARAEMVAQNLDQMLKAKIAERGAGQSAIRTGVFSDISSNRLFVLAPQEYQELAARLIDMVDTEATTTDVVQIIALEQGDAQQIAQTLSQVISGNQRGSGTAAGRSGTSTVRITADAGSNSILLAGMPKDLVQVEDWIRDLEINSSTVPELQIIPLKNSNAASVAETLGTIFGTAARGRGGASIDAVTITPDEYHNRLLVTTNKRKMRQVEATVAMLDAEPEPSGDGLTDPSGRRLYFVDIGRGDAYTIAWDTRDMFPEPEQGGPKIESDWFGEYITVKCRPNELDEIVAVIRQFEAHAKPEKKVVILPIRGQATDLMGYLQTRHEGGVTVEYATQGAPPTMVETLWEEGEEPPSVRHKREKQRQQKENEKLDDASRDSRRTDVRPFQLGLPVTVALLSDVDLALLSGEPAPRTPAASRPAAAQSATPTTAFESIDEPPLPPGVRSAGQPAPADDQPGSTREKPKVVVQPDGRSVIIYGDKSKVEELEDTINLLEEDLNVGEVIRIFEFKYGDVSAAAEVVQIMFNERPQIRLPQQQQPQQRGQQGQKPGDKEDDQQGMLDRLIGGTQRGQRGAKGGSADGQRVRIATDPGHNYLIIKCNQSDLPEIKQLLRELDIPPGEVDLRIFQLRNLVASETAEDIKEVLGINKAQQKRGGAAVPGRRAGQGANPQAQLMEMLQQQAFAVPGVEGGAKVERVEVVPNDLTNSLLVSAPPEVMKIIEKVIGELEDLEGREIVGIYEYQLEKAKIEDIVPLLQDIFAAAAGSGGGGGRSRDGGPLAGARGRSGGSPGALGPVTVSGDPRVNKVIFTCEQKDEQLVREQIRKLDIDGALAEAELYVCKYGDAIAIADTVEAIFGGGGGGQGRAARGGAPADGGSEIRIAADAATNTIVVFATPDKRDTVFAQIQALDEGSIRQFREIALQNADPVKFADTLLEMFGGASAAGGQAGGRQMTGRSGRGRQSGGAGPANITILGDKSSKKLLVRAPQAIFLQIEEMAAMLDVPNQEMQLRRYALQHANAEFVVEHVKTALAEYMQMSTMGGGRGGGGELPIDPFTAMPDPRTNSIMVVGSPQTFAFVETVLKTIDVETPADQLKDFRVFVLDKADAETVAQAINDFAVGGSTGTTGGSRGGAPRRSGGMPGGATGQARQIDVYAFAEPTTNTVMVSGRAADIELVAAQIIDPLEEAITAHREIATIPVTRVKPTEILGYIWDFMEQPEASTAARGGDRARGASGSSAPKIIPNDNSSPPSLVVHGSRAQIREITELVERFDNPDLMVSGVKLIPVPLGQDPGELAQEVERLFNDGEQVIADITGRRPRAVRIAANEQAKLLMLYGDSSAYGTVETLVNQITQIAPQNMVYRVIEFKNISAEDAQSVIDELQGRGSSRSSGSRRTSFGGSGGASSSPRSGRSSGSGGGLTPPRPSRPPGGRGGRGGGGSSGGARPADTDLLPVGGFPFVSVMMVEQGAMVALVGDAVDSQLQQPQNKSAEQPARKGAAPPATQPARKRGKAAGAAQQPQGAGASSAPAQPRRAPQARPAPAEAQPPEDEPAPPVKKPARSAPRRAAPPEDETEALPAAMPALPAALMHAPPPQTQPAPDLSGISGELRGDVVAQPLDSKRIIISGDAGDLDFIEQVLTMMDTSTPAALVNVFQLEYAKASALAPIIDKAIKARIDVSTARPGPADKFSVAAEARSNSLIVSASETIMEQIADLVERLDVEKAGGGPEARNVVLEHARASEAAANLKPILEKLNNIREIPKESQPSIEPIDRTNSILIIGTPKDLDDIEKLIHEVDIDIPPGESFVATEGFIVQLKNGQAEDVAKVINEMIKAEQEAASQGAGGSGSKAAGKPYVRTVVLHVEGRDIELNLERPIRLVAEKGTNSLIIFSTPKNNEALKEIVGVFDTLPIGADTEVRAIALKYAGAKQVQEVLDKVFKEGKKALARPVEGDAAPAKGEMPPIPPTKTGEGLPYNLIVQSDERSNTVVVVGRKDAVLLAAGLIAELDRPSVEFVGQPFVIQLKRYPVTQLEEKLKKMLDDRAKAVGGDQNQARDSAILLPDDRSNSLVVLATREIFDMIEDMALQLDGLESYSIVDTRYRRLEYADAEKLANMLQELFKRKADAAGKQAKDTEQSLEALADVRSNALMLVGTRDYLAEAETLIDNLDQKYDPTVVFHIRPVKLNSAVNIAGLLKDMVDKALKEQDSKLKGTPIYVAADPISDSLLLAASQEDMDRLEGWVNWLDRPSELGRMIRIIPMQHGSADKVSKTLSDGYKQFATGGSGSGAKLDISITFDATTNSVVAFAPPAMLAEIENSVRELDRTEAAGGTLVRIFNLEQADAQSAGELLTSILSLRGGSVGPSGGGRGSSAGSAGQEQIAKQVMLLFQRENPELGIQTLKALRGDVSVVSDLRTNSLVITAPTDGMALMEALVHAIDVPPNQAKVRVFPLRNADAEQMVKTLTDLFQQKTSSTSGGSRSGGSGSQETLMLSLGESVGGQEQISFTTDMRTNAVIAAGTRGYLDLVEQLVLDLDSRPVVERKTKVYAPRNMVAKDLADAVKNWSDTEKDRLQELGEDISLAVKQEAEIGSIPYEQSNRIILTYSPRKEEEVLAIVSQLDQQPAQVSIEVLIVEVAMGNSLELGVEWAFQDLQYAKAGPQDTNTFDFVGGTDVGAAGAGLGGFTFTITGRDFNFLLHALQSENSLNVLSRPHIVAMDNQDASIEIIDSIPFVTGSATTIGGSLQTSVDREDVGIKLEVKPQINPDGFVRMEIRQEVSDLSDSTIAVGPGITAPIFNKRIAETVVTVQDNETVVLGGLIQSRDLKTEQKVPLLGDLPLLGPLFRFQDDDTRRAELLVILTPRVIRTREDFHEISVEARDQNHLLPCDVKCNPLMRGLRLRPEELAPCGENGLLGPFPEQPAQTPDLQARPEEYGPVRPESAPHLQGPPNDSDSYYVPTSMLMKRRS